MTRTTLIIGGGAAGVLLAGQLCRSSDHEVILVDPSENPGAGVAYGHAATWHLLNSPAATMSADPDQPGHFMAWADQAGSPISAGDFAPRSLYGRYLRATLADLVDAGRLRVIRAGVTALATTDDHVIADLDDGRRLTVTDAILATGNPAGAQPVPGLADHPRYIARPWTPGVFDDLDDRPVLLIGTGLTAVDIALSVAVFRPDAPVHAVSRHGLLPQAHRAANQTATVQTRTPAADPSLAELLAAIRASVGNTGDWRAVVDGLRPRVDEYWRALSPRSKERFLEHLARHWEVYRHRMAPQIAGRVTGLVDSGRLIVRADRIKTVDVSSADRVGVTFADGTETSYGAVVNCTGPGRLPGAAAPVVARLLSQGLARVGPYRLGLDVDDTGRLIDAQGRINPRLWTIGAMRRGRLWETTAVPEIRAQAVTLATALVGAPAESTV